MNIRALYVFQPCTIAHYAEEVIFLLSGELKKVIILKLYFATALNSISLHTLSMVHYRLSSL